MEELDFELLFAKVEGHPQTGGERSQMGHCFVLRSEFETNAG